MILVGVMYVLSAIFFLLGLGMRIFKWDFLIAGYNTMSQEEKKNVDREALCKATGNFVIFTAVLLLTNAVTGSYGYKFISFISIMFIFPLTIIFIIRVRKYDHNKKTKANKIETKIAIGFTVFLALFLVMMFTYGTQDPRVDISDEKIRISGMYSASIERDKIIDISLKDHIPKVNKKLNGFDLGYILRGDFAFDEIGKGRVYIRENKPPFIVINTGERLYIINYKHSKQTQELYKELHSIIGE